MTEHTAPSPIRIGRAPALVAVFGAAGFIGSQGRFLLVADGVRLAAVGGWALAIRRGIATEASDISTPSMSAGAS